MYLHHSSMSNWRKFYKSFFVEDNDDLPHIINIVAHDNIDKVKIYRRYDPILIAAVIYYITPIVIYNSFYIDHIPLTHWPLKDVELILQVSFSKLLIHEKAWCRPLPELMLTQICVICGVTGSQWVKWNR